MRVTRGEELESKLTRSIAGRTPPLIQPTYNIISHPAPKLKFSDVCRTIREVEVRLTRTRAVMNESDVGRGGEPRKSIYARPVHG
jgi:hypothetical protein